MGHGLQYIYIYKTKLLLIIFLLSSCASMSGKNQNIMVDSSPRGQEFKTKSLANTYTIGRTPITLKVSRDSHVRFELPGNRTQTVDCKFRVDSFLIGNLIPGLVGAWPISLLGYAIDFFSGSAYQCPESIKLVKNPSKLRKTKKSTLCNKLYIFPPEMNASGKSILIAKKWFKSTKKKNKMSRFYTLTLQSYD